MKVAVRRLGNLRGFYGALGRVAQRLRWRLIMQIIASGPGE